MRRATLSAKRRRFVDFYCGEAEMNATRAAEMAGYGTPRSLGYRLVRDLQEVIDSKLATLAESSKMSAEGVVKGLTRWANDDKNPAVSVRALEILGRIHGLVTDKVSLTVDRKAVTQDLDGILDRLLSQPKADQPGIHKDSN